MKGENEKEMTVADRKEGKEECGRTEEVKRRIKSGKANITVEDAKGNRTEEREGDKRQSRSRKTEKRRLEEREGREYDTQGRTGGGKRYRRINNTKEHHTTLQILLDAL